MVEGKSRRSLPRSVAAGALLTLFGAGEVDRAEAACTAPGVTVDCTGDVSGGVSFVPAGPIQNLNVINLTAPIQPPAGVPGVKIDASGANGDDGGAFSDGDPGHGGGPLNVTTDGSQPIVSSGSGGSGVVVLSNGGKGGGGGAGAVANAGDGGNGGGGGNVLATVAGSITVQGPGAAGIFVQSGGGRGGDGGFDLGIGSPGEGGRGASGGVATVNNTANITTQADTSSGIVAVSIGGAGGDGGSCGIGCFGGGGGGPTGFGGTLSVTSTGVFTIQGANNSYGIFVQSVGGAGGAGGSNTFLGLAGWAADSQSGGNGGAVTVQVNGGSISTVGSGSSAIYAQSIGGGGGAGGTGIGLFYGAGGSGTSGGKGNTVSVTNFAKLTATGDQSAGIYAQSVGGGGGAGGTGGSVFASFGGRGGAGEDGGAVDVHNHGDIRVSGNAVFSNISSATLSTGIFAQSVGGGGGDGGVGAAGLVNFGGTGGAAGAGGVVTVENTATIMALCGGGCSGGGAIFAQSVGGGGGNGGSAFGVVSLGGEGGGGGDGFEVAVNNSGALTTTAQFSAGIFTQSVGGGGGNGAFAGGIASIGGSGAVGGNGHTVTVNNSNSITTGGADSGGIFAQSVGGGGGNGGGAVGAGLFVSFALGGSGGAGGNGGTVCVNTNNASCFDPLLPPSADKTIRTTGDRSTGILAQSIGGGGGNGGFAVSASVGLYGNVSIGAGGKGGAGGTGGNLFVSNAGEIITGALSTTSSPNLGQFSDGIDAESIGGGGGNGGFSVAAGASTGGAVSAAIGGAGGNGNKAGTVTVNTQNNVTTFGDQAVGIFARSIGGGGGNGGWAVSVAGSPYASVGLSFGGAGADGGAGDQVHVDNIGSMHTFGALSNGITAQSIGGGGGNGGFSVAGTVTVSNGGAASLSFGGNGGGGATGSLVHVSNAGDITTAGKGSNGILAQSIGGGGGNGGFAGALSLSAGASLSDSVGGGGGAGNTAGKVDVTSNGSITTGSAAAPSDNAIGIEAQSIGGGGGNGGFSLSVAAALDSFAIGIGKAGSGGKGGTSDTVNVTSNGTIETFGKLSYGILAQSIGGGGGNGGFAISGAFSESGSGMGNAVGGDGGGGNTSGAVTVTTNATATSTIPGTVISTHGLGAIGILAQSIGGGGGAGGFAVDLNVSIEGGAGDDVSSVLGATGAVAGGGGDASNGLIVTVNNNGAIATIGAAAHGIMAQSIGGGGGNGGFAIAGSFSNDSDASSNAIGGKGGGGGAGGQVIVNNNGDIAVGGDSANAIVAQSIGGGGGNGGFSIGAALSLGGKAASNSLGGGGGDGGLSSEVDVFNSNKITVGGAHAAGILAQSIGGGGGNGGFTIGAGISVSDSDGASDAVGGSGGKGGQGGIVKVTTFAGSSITTSGFMDYGIEAQSIGGGGGNGGFSVSGSFSDGGDAKSSVGGQEKNAACAADAGCGGGGGGSLKVTVDNAGGIETQGANSVGILAQSIGGGGGAGGFAASASLSLNGSVASNAVGGAGGDGGAGGEVEVTNQAGALIHTSKDNSTGIVAQSIGGGGGNGGFSIGAGLSLGAEAAANTIGGSGGKGGSSMEVDVTNLGAIFADGSHSTGILAQSVGGGGGNGGFTIGAAGSTGGKGASDSVGGNGGDGGNGGIVKVVNGPGALIVTGGAMDYGIQAQSIGGGGGNGGFVVAGSFSSGGDASSKIGGDCNAKCAANMTGGGGGFAMQVTVENSGMILTGGASSIGILAQSIGGGGGAGGFAGGLAFSASGGATSNSVGGAGGDGGAGGAVTVINHVAGVIHTEQANSTGIMAQSIGGGGGNGAFSISGGVGGGGNGVSQSVGGTGGKGGAGALVAVQNDGVIQTDGALSYGIYAQSIGGGGGAGGISVSGDYSSSGGATSTVGGQGAAGGAGGEVKVTNTGSILVKGAGSVGIYAQSVGGGGGAGGFSGALNFTGGGQLTNKVGGGGAGGAGGNVTVISTGSIETQSADSVAVIAQSIGGGGGNGAFSISAQDGALDGSTLQIGGSGAATQGANGNVIVDISGGTIVTAGDLSYGLLSQAIGAGGGNGALSVPDPLTIGILGSTQMVGASGAISGDGNPLDAKNANSIGTTGAGALGYVGQSIGGGGGTSGVTGDVTFTAAGPLKLVVGGSSSGGGSGGVASVVNTAALIVTGGDLAVPASGDAAVALLGQSIGGGGGSAIYSLGVVAGTAGPVSLTLGGSEGGVDNGGVLTLATGGDAVTQGRFAPGVVGQTVGGGGGFGAVTASSGLSASGVLFTLGSTGGSGGSGDLTGGSTWTIGGGKIITAGLLSDALVAQAIGAGGGLVGFVSDGAQKPPLASAILGAQGGAVGNGSIVTLINSSALATTGTGALGIIAQSIGGGGGAAQAYGLSGTGVVTLGASGGSSGDGRLVSVTSGASIITAGDGAHGILAQSIGGGGGFFAAFDGPLLSPTVHAGASGAGGSGGDVTVLVQGEIDTTGAGAHGVIAQSVGGGGGLVGAGQFATTLPTAGSFAGSVGGAGAAGIVTVDATASIFAMGADSTGIVASSTDATGRGNSINVGVATGVAVVGGLGVGGTPGNGDEPANAVRLIGGAANTLTSHGFLTTRSGIDGFTVTGGLGDDAIDNFGVIDGSVDLSAGLNSFHNEQTTDNFLTTGVFNSGAVVWLGGANLLTNDGLISPGAYLRVLTTDITGDFLQSATGVYGLDLEFKNQTADRINVLQTAGVGGVATVGGTVNVNILNPGLALPGGHSVTIVHAEGGETHPGLGLTSVPTAVANYGLSYTSTDINLDYAIDFSPSGLTLNEHAVGYAINNIQLARISPAFVQIAAALFYQPTIAALGAVYDSISGEGVSGFQQTAFGSNDLFLTSVGLQTDFWLSDRTTDASGTTHCERTVLRGPTSPVAPGDAPPSPPCERSWRAWFSGYGGNTRVAGEYPLGSAKLKDNNSGVSAGLDYQLAPDLLLGVAGGAGSSGFNVSARQTSGSLETGHVALYGAGRAAAFYATGIVAYDFSNVNENRFAAIPGTNQPIVLVPGFSEHLVGNFGADSISGRVESGWRTAYAGVNITPFGAFQFSSLNMHGFSETADHAPSVIGLTFSDRSVASLPSFLGVKLESGGLGLPGDFLLSASLRVSWMHEFAVWRPVTASFLAAPGFDFTVYGAQAPRNSARVNAGFKLDITPNMALFGNFLGDFSGKGHALAGAGGVRIAW